MAPVTNSGGDNETLPTFAYQPLSLDSSIRILELQPSIDPAAPLAAKLVDANIESSFCDYADFDYESNFEYEAVSYCWGEPLFTEPLILSTKANPRKLAVKLWVVQELVWSTNITMFCGQTTMPWLRLFRVLSDERLAGYKHDKLTLYRMSVRWKRQYFGIERYHDRCDLISLLEDYDDLDCANAKDRLFAIVGLATDLGMCKERLHDPGYGMETHDGTCGLQIEVNYGKSTQAIYMDAVARFILVDSTNASRILAMVACRSTGEKTPGPSWAPDWRLPRVRASLWFTDKGPPKKHFDGRFDNFQVIKTSPEDARLLILSDSFSSWGKVANMLDPFPGSRTDEQIMDWLRKTWEDLLRWVHTHNPGIEFPPAKQHILLEQLLDVIFVLPHDPLILNRVNISEKVKAPVRSYVAFDLYLQLNDEDRKSKEEMAEMHGVDDDEESIALTMLEEMPIMVQRFMQGRSVCFIDPLTYKSALVGEMLWPGLGIVPSHARPGDVVMAFNDCQGWHPRHWDQANYSLPGDMDAFRLHCVVGTESSMMLVRESYAYAQPKRVELEYRGYRGRGLAKNIRMRYTFIGDCYYNRYLRRDLPDFWGPHNYGQKNAIELE
ncbi:hypothetical protein PG984_012278 [Apiospora sp. TS-2023a]